MIQVEARLKAGDWGGLGRAYTSMGELAEFAAEVRRLAATLSGLARFECGDEAGDWIGVGLRLYPIGGRGHLGCHVQLASSIPWDHLRPEEVFKLSVELRTEPSFLDDFQRDLERMVRDEAGEAILVAV